MGKKKCLVCNGCTIPLWRGNQLYHYCSFCKTYYKALPGNKLELVKDIKEVLGERHGVTSSTN